MNREQILVIGDDPLSLQLMSSLLRDKGYNNVIVGNHIQVDAQLAALEASEAQQRQLDDALVLGIGNLFVGVPPIDSYKLKHIDLLGDCHGWSYDRKPPPHYRVNFKTGKPLRY